MGPALHALQADTFFDQSVQKSVTEYAKLAVDDVIKQFSKQKNLAQEIRDPIIEKLKKVKLWVMFTDEILNLTKIEELYQGFDLKGTETLFDLSAQIAIYQKKLKTDHWLNVWYSMIRADVPYYILNYNVYSKYD